MDLFQVVQNPKTRVLHAILDGKWSALCGCSILSYWIVHKEPGRLCKTCDRLVGDLTEAIRRQWREVS